MNLNVIKYLLILTLFLHPCPPSQWLVYVPLVIMPPQLTHGFPLPYGCKSKHSLDDILLSFRAVIYHAFIFPDVSKYIFNEK